MMVKKKRLEHLKKIGFKKGNIPWNKGKKTDTSHLKLYQFKKGQTPWNKGKGEYLNRETRLRIVKTRLEKVGSTFKGKKHTEEAKQKNSEKHLKLWKISKYRKKMLNALRTESRREKVSKSMLREWNDDNQREKRTKAYAKWRCEHPNKGELFLNSLIQKHFPNEWLFNTTGEVIFKYRYIPDWININGQKKVILLHGIFWHLYKERYLRKNPNLTREDIEREEQKKYGKYGFSPCIIWEDELKNPTQVVNKLNNFMEVK